MDNATVIITLSATALICLGVGYAWGHDVGYEKGHKDGEALGAIAGRITGGIMAYMFFKKQRANHEQSHSTGN